MPRRREVPKREVLPDPKFSSEDVAKFMNVVMYSGKKSVAERIVYGALDQMEKKAKLNPVELFHEALRKINPRDRRGLEPFGEAGRRQRAHRGDHAGRAAFQRRQHVLLDGRMARGLDHIVHAVRDLDAVAALYRKLGFLVGARNAHHRAWGTRNHIIQFSGTFIELLTVADASGIEPHTSRTFSFGAHNRDFLCGVNIQINTL